MEEQMLTLEKFEEASETVRKVTLETGPVVTFSVPRQGEGYILSRKTCSLQGHIRYAGHTIR